jgi:hypothetical protein
MIKTVGEIWHRIKVGLKAADIYELAHKLRARQLALETQMIHDDPAEMDQVHRDLITWDRLVAEFFDKHPDTLEKEAVWMNLEVANDLLITLQDMYHTGDLLWAFLSSE